MCQRFNLGIVGAMDHAVDTLHKHELDSYVTNVEVSSVGSRQGIVDVYLSVPLRLQVDPLGYVFKLMDGSTVRFETESMQEEHKQFLAFEESYNKE